MLFAFGGGSAIALVKQLDERQQKRAFQAIACLALSCLSRLYLAIVLSEVQLLTPREQAAARSSVEKRKYLRGAAGSIDSQRRTGALECYEAEAVAAAETGTARKFGRDRGVGLGPCRRVRRVPVTRNLDFGPQLASRSCA